jgi:hypothetical protein
VISHPRGLELAVGGVLTSWKEIAQYLGKGVRTVQRWEKEMRLPIHRCTSGIIFALPDEITAWIRSQPRGERSPDSELAALRRKVADLERQIKLLRAQLNLKQTGNKSLFHQ